jgi:tetratricopeptide (TPR) repeat protein
MGRIEKTVFLSYRSTNFFAAQAIAQNLTHNGYDVFFDFTSIASDDFEREILENITSRAHFLVLLTPSALEHCNDPADWLRREIETALDNQRNIVPLMLEGFDFSTPKVATQLTGKLAEVVRYNALRITPEFFFEAMESLRSKYLNVPLSMVLHPLSVAAQTAATEQKSAAIAVPPVREVELTAEQLFERGYFIGGLRLNAEAFNNRGTARRDKGDLNGALADFTEALRLKPDYAEAFNNRGTARRDKGDFDGALADFTEALRLKPDYAEAFNNRGTARRDKGDFDGALADFTEALRLKPDYAEALNNSKSMPRIKSHPAEQKARQQAEEAQRIAEAQSVREETAATEQQTEAAAASLNFYSCFISFSTKDEEFADFLYQTLTHQGVKCWFSPHDMRSGEKILDQIDNALNLFDRLLLILSESSIQSSWVRIEITKVRQRELREKRRILFPIRLVDFETLRTWQCFDSDTGTDSASEIREYFVPDFSNWKKQPDSCKIAFDRLLRDLIQNS